MAESAMVGTDFAYPGAWLTLETTMLRSLCSNVMTTAARKLTYDDFLLFPDDGKRHELIDGVHYVTPSPVIVHQRLVGRLHNALYVYLEAHRSGEVFGSPLDVVLSQHDVVEPDLQVILADQVEILTDANVRGAPAIVVEIASPSTKRRDEGIKRDLYKRAGVREYWTVDPNEPRVTVRPQAGEMRVLDGDAVLTTPLLPGFSLALPELFR
jgi:Uma2 family endonuclease